ncbi:MAG TPA: [FeFe] hydrogenase H-cluster maturation GTPase HydF [Bacteroidales bacterium]|nr:[FeFe] hydrogenase H-cluster maturation GTPase HydF [Bacteroidales bacterium]HPT01517.1 [FeFe] hydrogenase H-cluster maturation GTPase HydF [Bacteroidales bacterium]
MKSKTLRGHIGIFGRRNNGKSSLINAITGQDVAIVSDIAGTTTDPVRKTIEITGLGPVVLIDTAGIDDIGLLGEKRVAKTREVLKTIDLAILIITHNTFGAFEKELVSEFKEFDVPFFIVHNKADIAPIYSETQRLIRTSLSTDVLDFSSTSNPQVERLISLIRKHLPESSLNQNTLIGDLIAYGDTVLLVTPIDIEAPEGRLILPQVQVIRDILDNDGIAVVCKEREVDAYIRKMDPKPSLVITDSQVFPKADASIPKYIPLTSFSIVLARQKGDFPNYLKGTPHISKLKDGDKVLILESCSHHVSCDDIGRVKIPRWLSNFTGKKLEYTVVAGLNELPAAIKDYAIVIQCGGCMITRKQLINRLKPAVDAGIPVTNYGMAIAYVHGIYNRAVAPFVRMMNVSEDYL